MRLVVLSITLLIGFSVKLNAQIKDQATLEAVTDYLVQQAHLGNSVTSGLNIV